MANKNRKYINCKECGRKRYCLRSNPKQYWEGWTCSKGHYWEFKVGPAAQIVEVELERIIPKIKNLFDRDDTFLRYLRKR